MRFIPCDTDAWEEAEKKAKRKKKFSPARSKKRSKADIAKAHKNNYAR